MTQGVDHWNDWNVSYGCQMQLPHSLCLYRFEVFHRCFNQHLHFTHGYGPEWLFDVTAWTAWNHYSVEPAESYVKHALATSHSFTGPTLVRFPHLPSAPGGSLSTLWRWELRWRMACCWRFHGKHFATRTLRSLNLRDFGSAVSQCHLWRNMWFHLFADWLISPFQYCLITLTHYMRRSLSRSMKQR